MARIQKDYSKRGQRTAVNIAPSVQADEAKMGTGNGSGPHRESMIAHEKAVLDRNKRKQVPNQKLRAK